jgi:hypothetical protein
VSYARESTVEIKRSWLLAVTAACAALTTLSATLTITAATFAMVTVCGCGAVLMVSALLGFRWWPRIVTARLSFNRDGVFRDGERLLSSQDIVAARYCDDKLTLARRRGGLDIVALNSSDADTILAALGLRGTLGIVETFFGRRSMNRRALRCCTALVVSQLLAIAGGFTFGLARRCDVYIDVAGAFGLFLMATAIALMRLDVRISVGSDAIAVKHRFALRPTLIPLHEIRSVDHDGRLFKLNSAYSLFACELCDAADAKRLAERVGRRRLVNVTAPIDVLVTSEANEHAAGAYRRNAVPRDLLWRVLENSSLSTAQRESAARGLMRAAATDERARVAEVASSSVTPELCAALTNVLDAADEDGIDPPRARRVTK